MTNLPIWARVVLGILLGLPLTVVGIVTALPVVFVWAFVGGPVYNMNLRTSIVEKDEDES